MVDFYLRARPETSDRSRIALSRIATVLWGIVLFVFGLASRRGGKVLETGLTITSIAYGGLLGVFLLGVLTRHARQTGAIVGMLCGLAVNIYMWRWTKIAFTWYVTVGAIVTFVIGYAFSLIPTKVINPEESN
jgi:Na+/proline symporter